MDQSAPPLDFLLDLDARHDDLLERLDALDQQVARVLLECQAMREPLTRGADPASPTC